MDRPSSFNAVLFTALVALALMGCAAQTAGPLRGEVRDRVLGIIGLRRARATSPGIPKARHRPPNGAISSAPRPDPRARLPAARHLRHARVRAQPLSAPLSQTPLPHTLTRGPPLQVAYAASPSPAGSPGAAAPPTCERPCYIVQVGRRRGQDECVRGRGQADGASAPGEELQEGVVPPSEAEPTRGHSTNAELTPLQARACGPSLAPPTGLLPLPHV
jgi:hypothetical protein